MTNNCIIRWLIVFAFICLVTALVAEPNQSVIPALAADEANPLVPGSLSIALDSREKAWLNNHNALKVGGPKAFPPFHFFDSNGNEKGMAHDYFQFIMNQLGLKVEIQKDLPWSEILRKAQEKEIDVISCAAKTPDREDYLSFSNPYLSFPLVIISRNDSSFIGNISDLKGMTVTFIKDGLVQEWLRNDRIQVRPRFVQSPLDALKAVSVGLADAHIENLAAATYLIQEYGLANLKVAAPTSYERYNLHVAVRKDWPEFISIINKALESLSSEQHAAIRNHWLSVRYEHGIRLEDVWKWLFMIAGPMAFTLVMISFWNKRLRRQIIERKRMEEKLQDANRQLEDAIACAKDMTVKAEAATIAKSRFLTNMSHEIRTPLNAIIGFSQLMQDDSELSLEQKKRIEIINRNGEHLLGLLNNILALSKIESGRQQTFEPTTIDLHSLLGDLAMMFCQRAEAKNLIFKIDGFDQVPPIIVADEQKLRQVLINLLGNAVKFTDAGSVQLRVQADPASPDGALRLVFLVEDTGLGIAAEEMDRLFDPFEQTGAGRGQGTGLGLTISRQFARVMGGDVTVTSQAGKGSRFRLEILAREGIAAMTADKTDSRRVLQLEAGQPPVSILIVEDNEDSRTLIVLLLRGVGFEVQEAASGMEAVTAFSCRHPHLIVMDYRMPGMNGDEAIRRIRRDPGGDAVKIIALTADATEDVKKSTFAAGADDFLSKPFRVEELFDKIQLLTGVRYLYAEAADPVESIRSNGMTSRPLPPLLTREMVESIPEPLKKQLYDAAISCRQGRLLRLIEEITAINPELGPPLLNLVAKLDYGALMALFAL